MFPRHCLETSIIKISLVSQILGYRCQALTQAQTKGCQRTQVPQFLRYRCQALTPCPNNGCQRNQVSRFLRY
jgi:hypothetical protein